MKLLPKQENAVYYLKDKETNELLYGGAAGGGKSALGCLWLIEMCQKYPNSRWLMGRSKLKALKETTLNTFFELSTALGISEQFTYNAQSNSINWVNGSQILLKDLFLYPSDPNFDSLGSLEITGAFIDECNQIVYKAWQIVTSRCRFKLKEFNLIPKVLGSCNPSKNWTYKYFYKPNKLNELPKSRKFIQALPTDNPHLPDSYLESLRSLDKNSKQRLYYGNWEYDDDPATLIDLDSITDYWNGRQVKEGETKYMTIDVARKGKDKTVFRLWKGWVCFKRFSMDISRIDEVVTKAEELQFEYGISNSNTIADEDGVGGGVVDYLGCKGFVNNSRPIKESIADEYITPNYDNLKSQCSIEMAKKIVKKEVVELCHDTTIIEITSEEMEQVKIKDVDKDGKLGVVPKDKVKEMIGRSPDEWDSIMMRYYFELEPDEYVIY
ncbi:phage terminase large subunit [uncultured Wocania sp.]|uniref:phage terminase large subunit n=1 Tax=uncultured Wocania sp. TaxID=2834404 RepID=UPI0030FA106A